jgi:ERCC4-type nuclease
MKLYELSEVYNTMQSLELEDEQFQLMLDSFDVSLNETVEDMAKFIQSLEADADAYDKQIKLFSDKKKAVNKKIDSVKEYLKFSLISMGKEKVKGELFTVSFRKSSAVIIDDESIIPDKFKSFETICKVDKNEIKKAFADGNVTGAHIQENLNLQIK